MKNVISMNLKFLRKESGLSQEELAEKLGVSRQSVAKWESGENLPGIDKCSELAFLFGTTIDNLVNFSFSDTTFSEKEGEGKYFFGAAKVGERGQIVIPKHARSVFHINPGDLLLVLGDVKKGGIAIVKASGINKSDFSL